MENKKTYQKPQLEEFGSIAATTLTYDWGDFFKKLKKKWEDKKDSYENDCSPKRYSYFGHNSCASS